MPPSFKPQLYQNKHNSRDEDMHQTKKGNQWYFGMKAHIGVDAKSGLTHSLVTRQSTMKNLSQPMLVISRAR